MDEFVYISDHNFTKPELVKMERNVLETLNYEISSPTIKYFLCRYLRAADANSYVSMLANVPL